MKNLKILSFVLLFSVLVIAGCENANKDENLSCKGDDICPIEVDSQVGGIKIEENPTVIVDTSDEDGDSKGFVGDETLSEENGEVVDEVSEEPLMRKMVVDENATSEEIEIDISQTCAGLGGSWTDGSCVLEDGSVIYF